MKTINWVLSRIGYKKMKVMECISEDTDHVTDTLYERDTQTSHGAGLASSAPSETMIPSNEGKNQAGVSTNYTPSGINRKQKTQNASSHWFALRTTYGREKKAYDYLVSKGVKAFCPTLHVTKEVKGERRVVVESRLPNIFFAHGTEEELEKYVFDNVNLPFLRFYYRHYHQGSRIMKTPLIVPDYQIESLRIICESEANDVLLVPENEQKFKNGQKVRVIEGKFKGVEGRVARYHGQQRVAVIIDDIATIATAYLPSAFLEFID